jgi:hypothetical protein
LPHNRFATIPAQSVCKRSAIDALSPRGRGASAAQTKRNRCANETQSVPSMVNRRAIATEMLRKVSAIDAQLLHNRVADVAQTKRNRRIIATQSL